MKLKALLSIAVLALFVSTSAQAGINYELEDFTKPKLGGGVSYVQVEDDSFTKVSLSPEFNAGNFGIGFDVNLYLPSDRASDYDLQWLTLRHVSYQNKQHGFKWGRLRNLTLGYGLLMDNYDSGTAGTSEFTTEKAGIHAYTTVSKVKAEGVWTGSNTQGARVTYKVLETSPLFGSPLIVGATVVNDPDGVDTEVTGQSVYRASQLGYSADVALPVAGDFLTIYSEYAELEDYGKGASTGFKGGFLDIFEYRAEYRVIGTGFVPGYFGRLYESTSYDLEESLSNEQIDGFLVAAGATFLQGYVKAGAMYEKYDEYDIATASLGWQKFGNVAGVINYTHPLQGGSNATAQADLLYDVGKPWKYLIKIKRNYYDDGKYTESYSVEVQGSLDNIFGL